MRWMPESEALGGGPLVAIEKLLVGNPDWIDDAIEEMHRVCMYPRGLVAPCMLRPTTG